MVCHLEVTIFGWFDTKISIKDVELEYCTRGHLRSINNKLIGGQVLMLDGQEAHLYTIISSLHDLPNNLLLCLYVVSCSRCASLKGGNIVWNLSNSCDVHSKITFIQVYQLKDAVSSLSFFRPIATHVGLYQFIETFSKRNQILVMVCFQTYG